MFHKIICAVALSAASFITQAVEILDVLVVLVVFDQNTINGYSKLNTLRKYSTLEKDKYSNKRSSDILRAFFI